ncbi:hypothetical protein Zmor_002048 [Zophobas morio]|uniref:Uncharacterized protein n=1 Tax=Zophobas morio TaxID=2755281 RepID=A0AA38J027_9CUCU|nr:hypothetical protein Zmor_002048 [Zophobas morio]
MPGWPTNCESSVFQIQMVPSNLKLTIVAVIGPKEYCKLKKKFWNASKKSATSALADLELKLEFRSFYIKRTRPIAIPRSRSASFGAR